MSYRMSLDAYMALPWTPRLEQVGENHWRLAVPPLKDFEIFGPRDLVEAEWRDALRGLLKAYLDTQRTIPLPAGAFERDTTQRSSGVFELRSIGLDRLQVA